MIKCFLKAFSLILALSFFVLVSTTLLIFLPETNHRRKLLVHWMHHCSRLILQILDVHYWVEYRTGASPTEGSLLLANHVSYVDALLLAAQYPSVFVTSVEIKESFPIGWLAKCAGCCFVERRKLNTVKADISEMRGLLESGFNVVLFPEGTTSDGTAILPFKRSLLEAAVGFSYPVLPICINYRYCNGEQLSLETSHLLFYFGDMKLSTQLVRLLGVSEVLAELIILPPLSPVHKSCRRTLASASYQSIREVFISISVGGT
jgi:1-acyl-sn-glycerol-3-phosphate acyltransferase